VGPLRPKWEKIPFGAPTWLAYSRARSTLLSFSLAFCDSDSRSTPLLQLMVDLIVLAAIAEMVFVDWMLRVDCKPSLSTDQR
jgi:hypothetical protein